MVVVPPHISSALSASFSITPVNTGKRYYDKAAIDKMLYLLGLKPLQAAAQCVVIDSAVLMQRLQASARGPYCKQNYICT